MSEPSAPSQSGDDLTELEKSVWYHGLLPLEDAIPMVHNWGDFLVRFDEKSKGEQRNYFVTVMRTQTAADTAICSEPPLNLPVVRHENNRYSLNEKGFFDSAYATVLYYYKSKMAVMDGIFLSNAVRRKYWELDRDQITLNSKIGVGAFGEVSAGTMRYRAKRETISVAVKQAKLDAITKEQMHEMMREARLMRQFSHPNVVRFFGVVNLNEPIFLVMELATNGALRGYLQKYTDLSMTKKYEMMMQAAWGIEYIHSEKVIHRDIASRNCLYGDEKIKIADFGLARPGPVYKAGSAKRCPTRWLAPETLKTCNFTLKTDVWSFGILCWEIFNKADQPYAELESGEVKKAINSGHRMSTAAFDNADISKLISTKIWNALPEVRPSMAEICAELETILQIPRPNFAQLAAKRRRELMSKNVIPLQSSRRRTTKREKSSVSS